VGKKGDINKEVTLFGEKGLVTRKKSREPILRERAKESIQGSLSKFVEKKNKIIGLGKCPAAGGPNKIWGGFLKQGKRKHWPKMGELLKAITTAGIGWAFECS